MAESEDRKCFNQANVLSLGGREERKRALVLLNDFFRKFPHSDLAGKAFELMRGLTGQSGADRSMRHWLSKWKRIQGPEDGRVRSVLQEFTDEGVLEGIPKVKQDLKQWLDEAAKKLIRGKQKPCDRVPRRLALVVDYLNNHNLASQLEQNIHTFGYALEHGERFSKGLNQLQTAIGQGDVEQAQQAFEQWGPRPLHFEHLYDDMKLQLDALVDDQSKLSSLLEKTSHLSYNTWEDITDASRLWNELREDSTANQLVDAAKKRKTSIEQHIIRFCEMKAKSVRSPETMVAFRMHYMTIPQLQLITSLTSVNFRSSGLAR